MNKYFNAYLKFINYLDDYVKKQIDNLKNDSITSGSKYARFMKKTSIRYRFISDLYDIIAYRLAYEYYITNKEPDFKVEVTDADRKEMEKLKYHKKILNNSRVRLELEKSINYGTKTFKRTTKKLTGNFILTYFEQYRTLRHFNTSDKIFVDFKFLYELTKKINMSKKDTVNIILYFINVNIERGILLDENSDSIGKDIITSHKLINEYLFINPNIEKEEIIIKSINNLIEDILDDEAYIIIIQNEIKAKENIINELNKKEIKSEEKRWEKSEPTIDTPISVKSITKDEYEVIHNIKEYYDIDTEEIKEDITIDEIRYVASLLQLINTNQEEIIKFIRNALRNHKGKNPIQRYYELKLKIEYFINIYEINEIVKNLEEYLNEITLSQEETEDENFWYDQFVLELEKLEQILKNDYSYELGIKKLQV